MNWYQQLNKPSWAPREEVFGQVWSLLYPIIFAVNFFVFLQVLRGRIPWLVGLPFWINLALNLAYSPIQFGLRNYVLASVVIVLILITIAWCCAAVWPYAKWASVAFVPYFVWVSIATVLQISIAIKN